jgi:hypothetical protein
MVHHPLVAVGAVAVDRTLADFEPTCALRLMRECAMM